MIVMSVALAMGAHLTSLYGSDAAIDKQRTLIAQLEQQVKKGEQEIASLRKNRAANEERVRTLARQVETRNRLLTEQRKEEVRLQSEITQTKENLDILSDNIEKEQTKYGEMVREAYRNYKSQNLLTYLFSARDFKDMTIKVSNMRAVATLRAERIHRIDSLSKELSAQKLIMHEKQKSHEKAISNLTAQKNNLQRDVNSARSDIKSMSSKERKTLQQKELQQKQLASAITELQKLIKGNKAGASFSSKTANLNLPVVGGRVKQYRDNMAEVVGARGAKVVSIYEGKVVDIKPNRITGKYDIYVAHGEYITSYAGLESIAVKKDQTISRNGVLGVIGEAIDIITMEHEHKIVFGIYAPTAKEKVTAAKCFKK